MQAGVRPVARRLVDTSLLIPVRCPHKVLMQIMVQIAQRQHGSLLKPFVIGGFHDVMNQPNPSRHLPGLVLIRSQMY